MAGFKTGELAMDSVRGSKISETVSWFLDCRKCAACAALRPTRPWMQLFQRIGAESESGRRRQ